MPTEPLAKNAWIRSQSLSDGPSPPSVRSLPASSCGMACSFWITSKWSRGICYFPRDPDDLSDVDEVYPGGIAEGNTCVAVPAGAHG